MCECFLMSVIPTGLYAMYPHYSMLKLVPIAQKYTKFIEIQSLFVAA